MNHQFNTNTKGHIYLESIIKIAFKLSRKICIEKIYIKSMVL